MLGQTWETSRWVDDPVVAVDKAGKRRLRGKRGIGRKEERAGRVQ